MSWLFSQVLVGEYLGDISLDGEQSVQSNGNPTQQAYCLPDKMTEYSRLSRFGMMFKPLTETLGKELLMSYRADFHAKTSLPQEKEQELTENAQECGKKWQGLLARYDPNTHSLRTVQCSLIEDLNECLQTWPRWGSMRNGECFQQPMWEQTTLENEYGLSQRIPNNLDFFHTPNTTGLDGGSNSRKALKKRMETWPTPVARDYKDTGTKEALAKAKAKRTSPGVALIIGAELGGSLNPVFSEWLMGWPLEWTGLKPLETDKYHKWQQQHGTFLKED
jgi:hypothetical protein